MVQTNLERQEPLKSILKENQERKNEGLHSLISI